MSGPMSSREESDALCSFWPHGNLSPAQWETNTVSPNEWKKAGYLAQLSCLCLEIQSYAENVSVNLDPFRQVSV
jgi:hypothetical protein